MVRIQVGDQLQRAVKVLGGRVLQRGGPVRRAGVRMSTKDLTRDLPRGHHRQRPAELQRQRLQLFLRGGGGAGRWPGHGWT